MGRGRGQGASRNVLLGRRSSGGEAPKIFLNSEETSTGSIDRYIDSEGDLAVRPWSQKNKWVEKIINKETVTKIYAFFPPPGHPEFSKATVLKKRVEVSGKTKSERTYLAGRGGIHSIDDEPAVKFYVDDRLREAYYYKNSSAHRENDLPATEMFWEDGTILSQEWMIDGILHREGAPASIGYNKNGESVHEAYYTEGVLYNPSGEATVIDYNPDNPSEVVGRKHFRKIVLNGEEHIVPGGETGQVAVEESRPNGNPKQKFWFNWSDPEKLVQYKDRADKNHSNIENQPSMITYNSNGNKSTEEYKCEGKYHRTDGHALINYNIRGEAVQEVYYVEGVEYRNAEEHRQAVFALEKRRKAAREA